MCKLALCMFLIAGLFPGAAKAAQDKTAAPQAETVSCDFADGRQVTIRYNSVPVNKKERLRDGRIWMPGGSAMILFSGADLKFAGKQIPTGAYTVYLMPGKKDWTLIVSKNEKPDSAYDPGQDLARGSMDLGQLSDPTHNLRVYFGQMGPKQCNLRVYYGDIGAFTEFDEQ
ncbi:MAG TPA: DUF2911 domain-containing protein [Terriglobales bacterium]|nr:DUF2911 domain-containing protein [Terriglobales bacterium]